MTLVQCDPSSLWPQFIVTSVQCDLSSLWPQFIVTSVQRDLSSLWPQFSVTFKLKHCVYSFKVTVQCNLSSRSHLASIFPVFYARKKKETKKQSSSNAENLSGAKSWYFWIGIFLVCPSSTTDRVDDKTRRIVRTIGELLQRQVVYLFIYGHKPFSTQIKRNTKAASWR